MAKETLRLLYQTLTEDHSAPAYGRQVRIFTDVDHTRFNSRPPKTSWRLWAGEFCLLRDDAGTRVSREVRLWIGEHNPQLKRTASEAC